MEAALVRMENIGKRFDGKVALDGAWLELQGPEILGVVGDNGAGKSTLLKVLAGVVIPDQGAVFVRGKLVTIRSPRESQALGIEMVYQDFSLCPSLTVWENAFLGRYLHRSLKSHKMPFLAKATMRERVRDILQQLGINLSNLDDPIRNLSGGQQQAVAVCRSLLFQPEVLLLDEPTASMAVVEQEKILGVIRGFRERGKAVVMVTHNLTELFQVADRAMVLKEGRTIWCGPLDGLIPGDLAHLMFVGRSGVLENPDGSEKCERPAGVQPT